MCGSYSTGNLDFTRFRGREVNFLIIQRIHSRLPRRPAVNAGVDPRFTDHHAHAAAYGRELQIAAAYPAPAQHCP